MNEYEITYLSETHLNEEARAELDNAIDSQISDLGGSVKHSTPSMRAKLAYPIDKKTAAFTRNIHVELEPDKVMAIQTFLKKNKDIIRFRTIATVYRPGVKAEEASRQADKKETPTKEKKKSEKPAKKVTMEAVEKGIEDALEKEVK